MGETMSENFGSAGERVLGLTSWHDDWSGLRVAVLGLGAVGFAIADTVQELGCRTRVLHSAPDADRERLLDVIGAERCCDASDAALLADLEAFDPDLIVAVHEKRPDHPLLAWASQREVPVWSDLDLGWRLRDKTGRVADWICVAGAEGTTIVSQLTAHMLVAGGLRAVPVSEAGTTMLDALRDPQGYDAIVVEVSGDQLELLGEISPLAAVSLDHGPANVYDNTQLACVYNRADRSVESMVEGADVVEGARAISYGLDSPPPSGFGVVEGILIDRAYHETRRTEAFELVSLDELRDRDLADPRSVQQVLAASALARARGVEPSEIARALLGYTPDAHRSEATS